jgi:hypothetical protein
MKLICYPTSAELPQIRTATVDRDWMDATGQRFAYRCLPLNIANSHGWEILNPVDAEIIWRGGAGLDAIQVTADGPAHLHPMSHFGYGVVTFAVPALFRTEPGYDLYVTGPVNQAKDGIAPLTGIVETDWSPYTFTMNWRFTRPGLVRFRKGEPFCSFFPVKRGMLEATEAEFRPMESDPELMALYNEWTQSRLDFNKGLKSGDAAALAQGWQRTYFHGRKPNGEPGPADHRTKAKACPFSKP